jgi:hypothetical protein
MFSLTNQYLLLSDVNPRSERHGEDLVLAADLKLSVKTSNNILSEFDPTLKSALYAKPGSEAEQPELIDDPQHLPCLRFPMMGAIKWEKEFLGYTLRIHWGASGEQDIVLTDCGVDKFRFDCLDGGSVSFSFRVIAHPDAAVMGRLCDLIQKDIEVTLTPPEADPEL